jgi:hypothetical protein
MTSYRQLSSFRKLTILERMKEKVNSVWSVRGEHSAGRWARGAHHWFELERCASLARRQKVKWSALCRATLPWRCAKYIAVPCDVRKYPGPDIPSTNLPPLVHHAGYSIGYNVVREVGTGIDWPTSAIVFSRSFFCAVMCAILGAPWRCMYLHQFWSVWEKW